jgi:hypothetical protein
MRPEGVVVYRTFLLRSILIKAPALSLSLSVTTVRRAPRVTKTLLGYCPSVTFRRLLYARSNEIVKQQYPTLNFTDIYVQDTRAFR